MYGDDWEYAASRLNGTIVRFQGRPVWVKTVAPGMSVVVEYLLTGARAQTTIDKLDLKPVPLGYVRHKEGCVYLCRRPCRNDWRQGLRQGTMVVAEGAGLEKTLHNDNIARTIRGDYLPFPEAMKQIELGRTMVAWDREWAMCSGQGVYHKGELVGEWRTDGSINLQNSYKFLSESLAEVYHEGNREARAA